MLKWFLECYRPHRLEVAFVIFGSLLAAGLGLLSPMLIRRVMDELIPLGISKELFVAATGLLLLYAASFILKFYIEYVGRAMGADIEFSLRQKMFRHLLRMKMPYYDDSKSGQILSRIVNDIADVGNMMFAIPHLLIVSAVTITGASVLLFYLNWRLASVVLILVVFKIIEAVGVNKRMKKMFLEARVKTGDLSGEIAESLQGIRLVRAFHSEDTELEKMRFAGKNLLDIQRESFKIVGRMHGSLDFFSNATNLAITILGGCMISMKMMAVSDLIAFLLYMSAFMHPVFELVMLTEAYQRAMAGFTRYKELMTESESGDFSDDRNEELSGDSYDIEFSKVNFSYDKKTPLFENFDLRIMRGETVGIVGGSGGGKTTLCELLLGLYETDGGVISVGGHNISRLKSSSLRSAVGMIQQDVFLFSATVAENIAYGKPGATDDEIRAAARLAGAHEFIEKLPEGYDTFTGERGVKLSGGQKQRIAMARMFLRNPGVLILDEATSALDNETERQIQKTMTELSKNRTTLIVAHRLRTVKNADRIIVIEHGRISEEGTHQELLEKKGAYYRLWTADAKNSGEDEPRSSLRLSKFPDALTTRSQRV